MTDAQIQLAIALAPIVAQFVFNEAGQVTAILNKDMDTRQQIATLQASRSAHWPDLKFQTPTTDSEK